IQARLILQMREQTNKILAHHTGQELDKVAQDTDRDFWMMADEAVDYGVIDKVLTRQTLTAVGND
ncbi:MAG: ATP-dependent Clp protease proteolytic subunit, partial [bacterium]|nr:ATP-dependent Clp protease proteolytic subunit [bacterium]